MQISEFYTQKHLERAERGVKKSYYPAYVLSQMTLDEDLKQYETKPVKESSMWKEAKKNSVEQTKESLKKKSKRMRVISADNLFAEEAAS